MARVGDFVYVDFGLHGIHRIPGKVRITRILDDGSFCAQMGNNPHLHRYTPSDIIKSATNDDPLYLPTEYLTTPGPRLTTPGIRRRGCDGRLDFSR